MDTQARHGIGANRAPNEEDLAEAKAREERGRKFIYIIGELNRAAAEKQEIGNREKEIKTALKGNGYSPKALAIARKVKADPKGEDAFEQAAKLIAGERAVELEALDDLKDERREVALTEKGLRAAAEEAGINLRAVNVVRGMQQMDGQERLEFFDAMVDYPKWLKFW